MCMCEMYRLTKSQKSRVSSGLIVAALPPVYTMANELIHAVGKQGVADILL